MNLNAPYTCVDRPKQVTMKFIKTVLDEERQVEELRAKEDLMTKKNPYVHEQHISEDISKELRELKHEDVLWQKRRQQLHKNSLQLRQLKCQLRAAVVTKEMIDQKKAHFERKWDERLKVREKERVEKELNQKRLVASLKEQELKNRQKKEAFRKACLDQMEELNEVRKQELAEKVKDREMIDKLHQLYIEEQAKEIAEKERHKQITRKEEEEYIRLREEYRQQERAKEINEDKKNKNIAAAREEQQRLLRDEKMARRKQKELVCNAIGQKLYNHETEIRMRQNLILDLLEEELNMKEDERYHQDCEKKLNDLHKFQVELTRQKEEHEYKEELRKRMQDVDYLAKRAKRIAELNRLDLIAEEKRRQRDKEHADDLQKLINERKKEKAAEVAEDLHTLELIRNEKCKEQELIDNERICLFKTVPTDVLDYLPVGVLLESDREKLGLPPSKHMQEKTFKRILRK